MPTPRKLRNGKVVGEEADDEIEEVEEEAGNVSEETIGESSDEESTLSEEVEEEEEEEAMEDDSKSLVVLSDHMCSQLRSRPHCCHYQVPHAPPQGRPCSALRVSRY